MKKFSFLIAVLITVHYTLSAQNAINVMSYNIRIESKDDGENIWTNRKDDMVIQIKKYNPDILCLQEDGEKPAKYLEEKTKLKGTLNIKTRGKSGNYNGVYYNENRFKLVKEGHFFLNEGTDTVGKGWDAASFRMARWVEFKDLKNKSKFYVVNTHFDHRGVEARKKSAYLIVDRIKKIAGKKPVILTGDFNAKPESEAVTTIKSLLKDSREISKAEPTGPNGTFNGFNLQRKLDNRIDFVFVNDKIDVNSYDVSTDKSKTGNYISDHLPITVNITIKK